MAQVLCPNIFEDFETDQSRSAWNRLLAQYGAAHAVHLAFNVLIVYSNNVFHVVPFPLPGGYLTLIGICAAVSAAQGGTETLFSIEPVYRWKMGGHTELTGISRAKFNGKMESFPRVPISFISYISPDIT